MVTTFMTCPHCIQVIVEDSVYCSYCRQKLINKYGSTCLITGHNTEAILEAAHIRAYKDGGTFDLSNGLLLRADIHTLFDLGLIAINPKTLKVEIYKSLQPTSYRELEDKHLLVQGDDLETPDKAALDEHYVQSQVRVEAQ